MRAPQRLWEQGSVGAEEREALREARELDAPEGLHDDVWRALAAALPPSVAGTAGGAVPPHATRALGAALGPLKGGAVAVGLCASVAGMAWTASAWWHPSRSVSAPVAQPTVEREAPVAPGTDRTVNRPVAPPDAPGRGVVPDAPELAHPQRPAARGGGGPVVHRLASKLAEPADAHEESRMVSEARQALRSGDPSQALLVLDQVDASHPVGVLAQERELLRVEALVQSGQPEPAAARARTFVRTWPESPYVARMLGLVARP